MGEQEFKRRLALTAAELAELYERLDTAPDAASSRRSDERIEYRVNDIPVCVEHPQGGESRFLMYGRNLSRGGLSVLHGGYVHPGSIVRVVLRMRDENGIVVFGIVRHCRLIRGSCHELGIQFRDEVDLDDLAGWGESSSGEVANAGGAASRRLDGRLLLAESFEPERVLLTEQLGRLGFEVVSVATPGATLDAVQQREIDLVLCGLSVLTDGCLRTITRMREMAFDGTILLLTADDDPQVIAQGRLAGATATVSRPIALDLLVAQLRSYLDRSEPPSTLVSTAAGVPEVKPLLNPYIQSVRITADQIDRAYESHDIPQLRELCLRLKSSGCGYGFEDLTVAAMSALHAVDFDPDETRRGQEIRRLVRCSRALHEV
ncbi:MAG: response regulator [Phycisphaerales bacterium]|nr:response regulator [Phycisphaerales bacterium]NNM26369.1 response regulator [Phycisphaerales bacterium]